MMDDGLMDGSSWNRVPPQEKILRSLLEFSLSYLYTALSWQQVIPSLSTVFSTSLDMVLGTGDYAEGVS